MTLNMLSVYLLTLGICITLLLGSSYEKVKFETSAKYFRYIAMSVGAMVFLEMLGWAVDGYQGAFFWYTNYISNTLMQGFSTLPLISWFVYFDYYTQIEKKEIVHRRMIYVMMTMLVLSLIIFNLFVPIFFYIDETNHFVRSNNLLVFGGIQIVFLAHYIITVIYNKKKIPSRIKRIIWMLVTFPIAGTIVQSFYFGTVFIWPAMSFVLFITFIFVEKEEMKRDVVTGLYSRGQFQTKLESLLSRNKSFTVVMIDLDKFKNINDNFGHLEGDRALYEFSRMLNAATTVRDFAYRFAGDEFMLCISSVAQYVIDRIINMLKRDVKLYNETNTLDYVLDFSYGTKSYSGYTDQDPETIIKVLDERMYGMKKQKNRR